MSITDLLEEYKNKRDSEVSSAGKHIIALPEDVYEEIRTLDSNFLEFFRPISPC